MCPGIACRGYNGSESKGSIELVAAKPLCEDPVVVVEEGTAAAEEEEEEAGET